MIDPEVLDTLPQRQWSNGMAEAVKMGVIADPVLFSLFEDEHPEKHLTEIIHRAICAKRDIVQQDVHDNGQRQILNFGHTLGHALEAASMSTLLHGECVALGMLPFCSKKRCRATGTGAAACGAADRAVLQYPCRLAGGTAR